MSLPSYTIANGTINGFLDNQVVQANVGTNAMNPKMSIITDAVNDHASTLDILQGQISTLATSASSVQFNVKSSTYGAKGDGVTDDTAAIQKAINDAVAAQGIVVFPTGIYKITDKLTVAGNCSLTSDGASSGSYISQYTVAESIYITGSNVSISNLIFKTHTNTSTTGVIANPLATAASPHSNISITGCQFYDYSSNIINGIILYYASDVRIENCSFTTNVAYGITMYSCSKVFIYRNTFETVNTAIYLKRKSGTLVDSPKTSNVFISQNNITPVYMPASTSIIRIEGATNIYVDRNNIVASSAITSSNVSGILCASSDAFSPSYIQIIDNYIDNSTLTGQTNNFVGISVSSGTDLVISRNTIIECANAVTYYGSCDALISNNMIISPYGCAIYIEMMSTVSYKGNVIVSNNSIADVYNNNPYSYAIACILATSSGTISVVANSIRRGSKTSSYVNSYGLFVSASYTSPLTVDGAYINYSSNAFSSCAVSPIYQVNSLFWIYYELPTGDKVFRSPTGVAPTAGTWSVGDQVILPSPTAGGYIGYVCTIAGTPGTWKGYGTIQA